MAVTPPTSVATVPVPRRWSEVTPRWATAALSARQPGAVVADVVVADTEGGTNSRARLRLSYEHGEGPASVFVKGPGPVGNRLALVALRAYAAEARLLASGVELPLERPMPFASGVERSRAAAVVVMDDVTAAGGRPNDARRALGVGEVRSGLEGLAALHGAFVGRPLSPALAFLRPWRLGHVQASVSVASLARGLRRLADLGISCPVGARRLGAQFRASAALAAAGPQAVLHGDPHPGNTYSLPGGRTGFLDWQLVRTGHWSHDVGYFLVGSLDVADRRAHEQELVRGYLDALGRAGWDEPDLGAALARYRATPAFGLATWVHTLSFGSFQPAEVCRAALGRFVAAYEDLETDRALSALGR